MIDSVRIHATAHVAPSAIVGAGTSIWNNCQVRESARIGKNCILGKDVYVDHDVAIGDNVKIQNGAQLFHGLTVESGVFIGPGAIFTNDRLPRAISPDGSLKQDSDWTVGESRIGYGASIGAGAILLPGLTVGRFAMVGAGAVVTHDVPAHRLALGNPARLAGYVCACGSGLTPIRPDRDPVLYQCPACDREYSF